MDNWVVAIQLSSPYLLGIGLAAFLLLTARAFVFFWMTDEKPPVIGKFDFDTDIVVSARRQELRPVEFAYLMRGGDVSHALAVLVVDLLQRGIKRQASSLLANPDSIGNLAEIPLADYEVRMWQIVKNSIKRWANEKKESVLLESFKKDPAAYVRRWSSIYSFARKNLKPFISGVTKDPRNLRKYFSFGGIFKLLADFSTAGYQQSFERELKQSLLDRGLLVTQARKETAVKLCFVIALVGTIAAAVFASVVLHSFLLFALCSVVAFLTRGVTFIKQLIPYYVDVLNLFGHIERGGLRLKVAQTIAAVLNNIFYAVSAIVFLVGIGCISLYLHTYGQAINTPATFMCVIGLSCFMIACCDVALSGWRVGLEEWQTVTAQKLTAQIKKKIRSVSPLEEFKNVLQTAEYDETFSDVVALYGIETLLFLA